MKNSRGKTDIKSNLPWQDVISSRAAFARAARTAPQPEKGTTTLIWKSNDTENEKRNR